MDDVAIALDIRDPDEHANGHSLGSLDITHGKLEMSVEGALPDLMPPYGASATPNYRGALSTATSQSANAWR